LKVMYEPGYEYRTEEVRWNGRDYHRRRGMYLWPIPWGHGRPPEHFIPQWQAQGWEVVDMQMTSYIKLNKAHITLRRPKR